MPRQCRDGAADRLLQMLRHPPVILFLKIAHCDQACPGSDGEFLLRRRPPNKGCRSVDSEQDEGRLPAGRRGFPDIGVAIYDDGGDSVSMLLVF